MELNKWVLQQLLLVPAPHLIRPLTRITENVGPLLISKAQQMKCPS